MWGWVIVSKEQYEAMKQKLYEYESEDPLYKMKKIVEVLDAGHLDKDGPNYQETVARCGLELIAKYAKIADLYSKATFIKDAGEDTLNTMKDMNKGFISSKNQIEDKRKKK